MTQADSLSITELRIDTPPPQWEETSFFFITLSESRGCFFAANKDSKSTFLP